MSSNSLIIDLQTASDDEAEEMCCVECSKTIPTGDKFFTCHYDDSTLEYCPDCFNLDTTCLDDACTDCSAYREVHAITCDSCGDELDEDESEEEDVEEAVEKAAEEMKSNDEKNDACEAYRIVTNPALVRAWSAVRPIMPAKPHIKDDEFNCSDCGKEDVPTDNMFLIDYTLCDDGTFEDGGRCVCSHCARVFLEKELALLRAEKRSNTPVVLDNAPNHDMEELD